MKKPNFRNFKGDHTSKKYIQDPSPSIREFICDILSKVVSRSSNASSSRPVSRESQATTMTPTSYMSQDVPHRFTLPRGTVHPMMGTGPNMREAFGPRANVMSTDNPPLKFLPEEEKEGAHDSSYEDETGGLEGLRQPPEDRDTLPNTETLLFRDGRRRIDMVLVYEEEDFGVMTEMEMLRRERRKMFLENLEAEGLELELEDKSMSYDGKTFFVKVHVPWKALTRYAEVMNLKLPTKENEAESKEKKVHHPVARAPFGGVATDDGTEKVWFPFNFRKMFEYNQSRIAHEPSFYTDGFTIDNDDRFLVKDRELFYTSSQRSLVVWQVLLRAKFDESGKVGVRRLLNDRTFLGAFPLHEGRYDADSNSGYVFDRRSAPVRCALPCPALP